MEVRKKHITIGPVKHKRSSQSGNTPATNSMAEGELAINKADKLVFFSDGTNIFTAPLIPNKDKAGNLSDIDMSGFGNFLTVSATEDGLVSEGASLPEPDFNTLDYVGIGASAIFGSVEKNPDPYKVGYAANLTEVCNHQWLLLERGRQKIIQALLLAGAEDLPQDPFTATWADINTSIGLNADKLGTQDS